LINAALLRILDETIRTKLGVSVYRAADGRWIAQTDLTLTVNVESYALPERCWSGSMGQVSLVDSAGNESLPLEYVEWEDLVAEEGVWAAPRYTFVGDSLQLLPAPTDATLTLRVPATAYNQVMNGLRRMAVKVVNENGSTRDVTEEFTDLDAQIRNLQAMEVQYLELLKRANTIDEILKVQARLSDVRGQIERNKGRMNLLQRTSDMATIAVTLSPADAVSVKKPHPAWDPAATVQEAWEQSLVIVRAVADVGLRVVVFSWWLLPPALLTWGVWAMSRRPQRGSVEV